jgi:ADP-ribose pyrophosphatase YjhB (NUDIX family)
VASAFGDALGEFEQLVAPLAPSASEEVDWPRARLRVAAYVGPLVAPEPLVSSVRCVVLVDGSVVICQTPHDVHLLPGGRREPGESYEETCRREVYEETGLSLGGIVALGFLRFSHLASASDPDFVQAVFGAKTSSHGIEAATGWSDVEGWERNSRAVPIDEARSCCPYPTQLAFLDAALARLD